MLHMCIFICRFVYLDYPVSLTITINVARTLKCFLFSFFFFVLLFRFYRREVEKTPRSRESLKGKKNKKRLSYLYVDLQPDGTQTV